MSAIKAKGDGPIGRWTEDLSVHGHSSFSWSYPALYWFHPGRRGRFPACRRAGRLRRDGDLTIHRITSTHHGRTLLTLGHAAEYLANSRRYSTEKVDHAANIEAIHILMEASRGVFEDFAERTLR